MNLEDYRKQIYAYWSESNLQSELCLLDASEKHQQKKYLTDEQKEAFDELVDWIMKEKPGLNDLSDEIIGKRFRVRKYEKIKNIKNLAFYEVGKRYSKKSSKATLNDFEFFSEHMGHGFDLSYKVSKAVLSKIVDSIDGKSESFLDNCRSMHDRRGDFAKYCLNELQDEKTDAEIIEMMNPYNGGDYIELPLGIYDLSYFLLRDKRYDLYARLLSNLYFFPLQGAMMCWMHGVDAAFAIWKEIERLNPKRINVIQYLLRNRILKLLGTEPNQLDRNARNEYIQEKDRKLGEQLLNDWINRADKYANRLVKLSINRFGASDTSVWYSRKKAQLTGRDPKFIKFELAALDKIEKSLKSQLDLTDGMIADKDLDTLIYYAGVAAENDSLSKDFYVDLIKAICQHIYCDRYVRPLKLDNESFQTMRNVYRCVLIGKVDGIQTMSTYRQTSENGQNHYSNIFRNAMGDSWWLSIMVLMAEETGDVDYFRKITGILLKLASFEKSLFNEYYFLPLYIAELIVVQVLKGEKNAFENCLITRACNLYHVLRILLANNGVLSDDNIKLLKNRVEVEWQYEKSLAQQYKQPTDYLEEYLKKAIGNNEIK